MAAHSSRTTIQMEVPSHAAAPVQPNHGTLYPFHIRPQARLYAGISRMDSGETDTPE